ncbi:pilus assembly protein PilP [Bdellovibrio sp. NC01]|uniref:pilus assembly protein PilP n=1 Tax=Bdellovibrio sp. NC01 TaxID=2220073 RepID=UPI00115B9AA6|nr:pilus assembly protein PilP [Bdellovibrio sp. NC01]QDK36844.1 fimbrial assembly protein [Bdellovibrio sp. NC01]
MKSVRWMMSYILVASLGLWLAFAVSMKFMAPAHSQEAPSNGDLPPEFMKEVEATQVPSGKAAPSATPSAQPVTTPAATPKMGSNPSSTAAQPTQPAQQQVPPPPPAMGDEMPLGDSMTAPQASQGTNTMPRDEYIYDPTGKRDPFKPFKVLRPIAKNEKTEIPLEPLQRFEVDRLQIVGILWDVKTPRAMVRDPDGAVYTVTKNSKIGRNEGFVAAIREGEIVVVETKYEEGKPVKETRVMEFKK